MLYAPVCAIAALSSTVTSRLLAPGVVDKREALTYTGSMRYVCPDAVWLMAIEAASHRKVIWRDKTVKLCFTIVLSNVCDIFCFVWETRK